MVRILVSDVVFGKGNKSATFHVLKVMRGRKNFFICHYYDVTTGVSISLSLEILLSFFMFISLNYFCRWRLYFIVLLKIYFSSNWEQWRTFLRTLLYCESIYIIFRIDINTIPEVLYERLVFYYVLTIMLYNVKPSSTSVLKRMKNIIVFVASRV